MSVTFIMFRIEHDTEEDLCNAVTTLAETAKESYEEDGYVGTGLQCPGGIINQDAKNDEDRCASWDAVISCHPDDLDVYLTEWRDKFNKLCSMNKALG